VPDASGAGPGDLLVEFNDPNGTELLLVGLGDATLTDSDFNLV
jgi:hypothetical protein